MHDAAEEQLLRTISDGGVLVLAGAGMSTAAGLPDYRGPDGERRVEPMTVAKFRATEQSRRYYWARSYAGWQRFTAARPATTHVALARLSRMGLVDHTITQNVDGLDRAAGNPFLTELHGRLDQVICLDCRTVHDRDWMQRRIRQENPGFAQVADAAGAQPLRPDGDVDLGEVELRRLVRCPVCGSDMLKPHVVMFGESVPKPMVQECFERVESARAVVVLGSSLGVMSGFRFARRAVKNGTPLILVNTGWSRAEEIATAHVHRDLTAVLGDLLAEITQH